MLFTLAHRLRPLLIGLVVLVLTAGVAFAGKPSTPADGQAVASEASGKAVPVANEETPDADEDTEAETETDEDAAEQAETDVEAADASDNCSTDPTGLTAEQLAELTHGQIVCWAAHQETPAEFDNHGAWVSSWAKQNHGQEIKSTKTNAAKGLSNKP